jgi:hypothetical protein
MVAFEMWVGAILEDVNDDKYGLNPTIWPKHLIRLPGLTFWSDLFSTLKTLHTGSVLYSPK